MRIEREGYGAEWRVSLREGYGAEWRVSLREGCVAQREGSASSPGL